MILFTSSSIKSFLFPLFLLIKGQILNKSSHIYSEKLIFRLVIFLPLKMDDQVQYIRYLDQLANQNRGLPTGIPELQQIVDRPDAIQLAPIIMANAETDQVLLAGTRILQNVVFNQYQSMSPDEKINFRNYIIQTYHSFPVQPVKSSLERVVSHIALQDFPDSWPDFITNFVLLDHPQFQFLAEFINLLFNYPLDPERYTKIKAAITAHVPILIQYIFNGFPESASLLTELIPFMDLETVVMIATSPLFQVPNQYISVLCRLLITPNFPVEHVRTLFNLIASVTNADSINDDYFSIQSLLQQYLEVLEHPDTINALNYIHDLLMTETCFLDSLEYWEFFLLSLYAGNPERSKLHQKTIMQLLLALINDFACPPDFSNESTAFYEQERPMMLCLLHISQQSVVQQMSIAYSQLAQSFDVHRFKCLVWAAASLSSAVNLDDDFALSSLRFVYSVYMNNPTVLLTVSCFIYLAMHYVKAEKISQEMLEIACQFALNGVTVPDLQRISASFLLVASKMTTVPGLDCNMILNLPDIKPDIYMILSEATARSYMLKNELAVAVNAIGAKWQNLQTKQVSFDFTRELRIIMCGLIGYARANIECVASILTEILPSLQQSTAEFTRILLELHGTSGENAKRRDDASLMIGFIKNEAQLFKEMRFFDCIWLIEMCSALPPDMRPFEILSLASVMVQSNIPQEVLTLIRNNLIIPVEMLINQVITEENTANMFDDNIEALSKLIFALSATHYECITSDDISILLQIMKKAIKPVVVNSLLSLRLILQKSLETLSDEMRTTFFRQVLPAVLTNTLLIACEPSHRFCICEIIEIIEYCVGIIVNGQVNVQLFEGFENIPGMATKIASEIVSKNPRTTISEMSELCLLLFRTQPTEAFEEIIVEIASKAKDSLPSETMRHLQMLKTKSVLFK
ncbi:hypothetical protein TRFO_41260 [Tritrichomonas foetus]|uniref:Importin N-terminal domain-containing protein n=1 Tax=Tritrichomonas foetus TaxID=1144522 RepID=A0A1J4L0X6_9EUKA|nr:hypothetical protein TRFO_41260 [Tritrichomonas foetus]|eukprot:OHT17167.1 hypothetical protein TRFO_41260 [Tritrichomonas foetus]